MKENTGSSYHDHDNFPHGRKLEKAILAIAKAKGNKQGPWDWDDEKDDWIPRNEDSSADGADNTKDKQDTRGKSVKLTKEERHGLFGRER